MGQTGLLLFHMRVGYSRHCRRQCGCKANRCAVDAPALCAPAVAWPLHAIVAIAPGRAAPVYWAQRTRASVAAALKAAAPTAPLY